MTLLEEINRGIRRFAGRGRVGPHPPHSGSDREPSASRPSEPRNWHSGPTPPTQPGLKQYGTGTLCAPARLGLRAPVLPRSHPARSWHDEHARGFRDRDALAAWRGWRGPACCRTRASRIRCRSRSSGRSPICRRRTVSTTMRSRRAGRSWPRILTSGTSTRFSPVHSIFQDGLNQNGDKKRSTSS